MRPRPGDTCEVVFERLRKFPYLDAGFITAQIVRDLKQVEPLRSAPDWSTFVRSGPGSQRGINRVLGATTETEINSERPEPEWRALFWEIVNLAIPRVAEHGIELDAQSWQNCFCELDKFLRFRSGDLRGARLFRADGEPRARRARAPKPALSPAPVEPVIPTPPTKSPSLAAPAPNPFANLDAMRLSQDFVTGARVKKLLTTVPVRRPGTQDFFRVHPDAAYQIRPPPSSS